MDQLTAVTAEEKKILAGLQGIDPSDYQASEEFTLKSERFLTDGRQIQLRRHTRFTDFPEHGHDYMEFMYVYAGSITHMIDGTRIVLQSGDILFLNRHIRHSILRAEEKDIGINFIASNAFLQYILHNVENNAIMHGFLTRNFDPHGAGEYLHFRTQDCFPIRNLLDNLIYAVMHHSPDDYAILSQIVSLLFTYLAHYQNTLGDCRRIVSPAVALRQSVCIYIEQRYTDATLTDLANRLGYTEEYLSRRIHELCGKTFRALLAEQRLSVAEKLLTSSDLSVEEIIRTVGYENQSYFHRIFRSRHCTTPYRFRMARRNESDSSLPHATPQ